MALRAFAGPRPPGETAGLKVSDIDFLGKEIHVRRQVQRDGVRPPKYGSERTVYAPEDLVQILAEHVCADAGE